MVWTAGRCLRRTHVRLMHSTSGVCVCCLASNGTNLFGIMMYEANEATQTHCYNPVAPAYPVWAYYAHGRQCRCQEDSVSLPSGRPRRQPSRPCITWLSTVQQDLKHQHLTLPEAADLAQNRPQWRMMSTYGATQSQSCMPETTMTISDRTINSTTGSADQNKQQANLFYFCHFSVRQLVL